jgi:hypothetical protein
MATDQELAAQAVAHAQRTTINHREFLRRVATIPGYAYEKTQWFQALSDLEKTKHPETAPAPKPPPTDPAGYLKAAQARIFLAHEPLACLAAPQWMVPVCTADLGYRNWYPKSTIDQLRARFGKVEAWCDCRNPTPYSEAQRMVNQLNLDGPAWGQCETTAEFDHAIANGARRLIGNIDTNVLDDKRLGLISDADVLVSVELYCNVQPWVKPDWRNANAGIGGNCIACYESKTENANYTPVTWYRQQGFYVPGRDSVYGVGLTPEDWNNLA